eukprot:262814_1
MAKQHQTGIYGLILLLFGVYLVLKIPADDLTAEETLQDILFTCLSVHKDNYKIDIDANLRQHEHRLSLIVGDQSFTDPFGTYCQDTLGMKTIQKPLSIAASFEIIDNDKYEKHPNYEFNEIHAPFFTNKEYHFRYNVRHLDYIYLFIHQYNTDLMNTFKLIDYSNHINATCFVLITDMISTPAIQRVESYLQYS